MRSLVVLLLVVPLVKGQLDSFNYRKVSKNREVVLAPTINKTVDSMVTCAQMCSERKKCVSLSFNSISKECKLYIHYITDTTTTIEKKGEIILSLNYMLGRRELTIDAVDSSSIEIPNHHLFVTYHKNTCFVSESTDTEPWLLINLGAVHTVSDVVVHTSDSVTVQHKFHDVNFELYSVDPRLNPGVEGLCCGSTEGLSASRIVIVRCSCNVAGRYLKIYVEKSELLTICYVQVLTRTDASGCVQKEANICKKIPRGPNLATMDKETIQAVYTGITSRYAVDGNRSTCVRIRPRGPLNYWTIDLGAMYNITSITIANILDHNWVDLKNIRLEYSTGSPQRGDTVLELCKFVGGSFGATTRTFECDNPGPGRHVLVETTERILHFCTIEVTGQLVN